jgi:flagellar biosynthesis GTPase FlhF
MHSKKDEIRKRPAPSYECDFALCGSTFDSNEKQKDHFRNQHSDADDLSQNENSPSSSPDSKKPAISDDADIEKETSDVEMKYVEEITVDIHSLLEKKIKQLEQKIQEEKEEKETMKKEIEQLKSKDKSESIFGGFTHKVSSNPFKIPKHLRKVSDKHLTRLRGFKMRYLAIPDGACLTNCVTAHISCTEDEEERKQVNKKFNNHIADNFDSYYQNIETVGVGSKSRTVKCKTSEEFLTFLRSEDSLCAFSNSDELEWNFKCNICDEKIIERRDFMAHKKTKHG